MPDKACTPGWGNPAVTQATIGATICKAGWATSIRPAQAWSEPAKKRAMKAYGYPVTRLRDFEYDHLIPLSLGGDPMDVRNLWPELGASPNRKDAVEARANAAVCQGRWPLAAAQKAMARDWRALGRKLGVKGI